MKLKRQNKILELVGKYDIETQEMLAYYLIQAGYNVTQATISRDIRELHLTKTPVHPGKQKYTAPADRDGLNDKDRLKRVFKEGVVSISCAQNIIVIKTLVGMAMAVCAAVDSMKYEDIVGTIAGDDTIFCAVKNEKTALALADSLNTLVS